MDEIEVVEVEEEQQEQEEQEEQEEEEEEEEEREEQRGEEEQEMQRFIYAYRPSRVSFSYGQAWEVDSRGKWRWECTVRMQCVWTMRRGWAGWRSWNSWKACFDRGFSPTKISQRRRLHQEYPISKPFIIAIQDED